MKTAYFILLLCFLVNYINGLEENDACTNPNGESGVCKKYQDCKELRKMLNSGMRPTICRFQKTPQNPILCCPVQKKENTVELLTTNNDDTTNDSKLEKLRKEQIKLVKRKCEEYGKLVKRNTEDPVTGDIIEVDHCGRVAETMITGGTKALPKEFPHMALIGYTDEPDYRCGGSLISERFVLSAAHCSKPNQLGPARWVKLGELDTSSDFDLAAPEVYRIIQILDHPEYNAKTLYNDITLFKLDQDVAFNEFIRPICLETKKDVNYDVLVASGWGHTDFGGVASADLLKVSLDYVAYDSCNAQLTQSNSFSKRRILPDSMVCAGNEVGKSACQGDSGGPLQVNISKPYCMYDLVGVTSFGRGCGSGDPGVYSRVSHYIPWIVPNVWPNN